MNRLVVLLIALFSFVVFAAQAHALSRIEKTTFGRVTVPFGTGEKDAKGVVEVTNENKEVIAKAKFFMIANRSTTNLTVVEEAYDVTKHNPRKIKLKRVAGKARKPTGLYVVVSHEYTVKGESKKMTTGHAFVIDPKTGSIWQAGTIK